ncbi:MAG: pyridoxal 5'-phosphate synthase glutaminase subunit PdxT [Clostridium sp.]|nr:pyridoxal 5'-phosphate synthase glutaminase subunit PdxT [Clostridium sp.]
MLKQMSVPYKLIRSVSDMEKFDRLILPGGESTAQRKLLHELELYSPLKSLIKKDVPTFGTCAGLILLSEIISGGDKMVFGTLPVKVCRNAYGRQLGSFSAVGNVGDIDNFPMRFIRAPYIESVLSDDVEILNVTNGRITAVRYKNQLGVSFHPELTNDTRLHELLMTM